MRQLARNLLLLFCLPFCLWSAKPFKANDRVAFIGDSITHGGSYHTFIQTFYATRFPERNVICFNVGISGDNAQGGFQRASAEGDGIWESDVRMYKPTAATIMLGMNDVGGGQFSTSTTRADLDESNEKQLGWYAHNYARLLDNVETLGLADITLIKSSPYDQTMVNEKATDNLYKFGTGKNDAICKVGEKVIDVESKERGYAVIDFNAPMLAINAKQQAINPSFSIIGNDRVHPGIDGHMVMAYTFLKEQGLAGPVAQVTIDAQSKSVRSTQNCTIHKLKSIGSGLSFEYIVHSLPFPTKPYKNVAQLIPFESEFNQETLCIQNLNTGEYTLHIDQVNCGQFTAEQLASGINLAVIEQAPQVKQANQVFNLCRKRAALSGKIRSVVWAIGYLSKIKDHDANDLAANEAMIARIDAGEHPKGLWGAPSNYVKSQLHIYQANVDNYQTMIETLESMTDPLYLAAQPKPHSIQISQDL